MTPLQMYIDRAAECRREADATSLVNVRARCLGSALAWEHMAERAREIVTYRAAEAQRKAEQVKPHVGSAGVPGNRCCPLVDDERLAPEEARGQMRRAAVDHQLGCTELHLQESGGRLHRAEA